MFYFLVYNDNTHISHLNRLLESVKQFGKIFKILIFNKHEIDSDFVSKYNSILTCERGGGYWLWKPYIINEILKKIHENDVLLYLDSKYYFIESFIPIIDYLKTSDIVLWKNKPNEECYYMKNWCKMDVIHKYLIYEEVINQNALDCWAGAILMKKTDTTVKYMQEWLSMCCHYENITDSPSIMTNEKTFIEHRHDQSLLSIIALKYEIPLYPFEKYLQNVRNPISIETLKSHQARSDAIALKHGIISRLNTNKWSMFSH